MIESIKVIQENLKISYDRQKSSTNNHRRTLQFEIKDKVFPRLSPRRGLIQFWRKGKLSPWYIEPYGILACVGLVAYKLKLSTKLSRTHKVFHVSILRKYVPDPSHVLQEETLEVQENLTYVERPLGMLDKKKSSIEEKSNSHDQDFVEQSLHQRSHLRN